MMKTAASHQSIRSSARRRGLKSSSQRAGNESLIAESNPASQLSTGQFSLEIDPMEVDTTTTTMSTVEVSTSTMKA